MVHTGIYGRLKALAIRKPCPDGRCWCKRPRCPLPFLKWGCIIVINYHHWLVARSGSEFCIFLWVRNSSAVLNHCIHLAWSPWLGTWSWVNTVQLLIIWQVQHGLYRTLYLAISTAVQNNGSGCSLMLLPGTGSYLKNRCFSHQTPNKKKIPSWTKITWLALGLDEKWSQSSDVWKHPATHKV